jgi:hypothetical protein
VEVRTAVEGVSGTSGVGPSPYYPKKGEPEELRSYLASVHSIHIDPALD